MSSVNILEKMAPGFFSIAPSFYLQSFSQHSGSSLSSDSVVSSL